MVTQPADQATVPNYVGQLLVNPFHRHAVRVGLPVDAFSIEHEDATVQTLPILGLVYLRDMVNGDIVGAREITAGSFVAGARGPHHGLERITLGM